MFWIGFACGFLACIVLAKVIVAISKSLGELANAEDTYGVGWY